MRRESNHQTVRLLAALVFCAQGYARADDLVAIRAAKPPKLDGVLSEAIWQTAQPASRFTLEKSDQAAPKELPMLNVPPCPGELPYSMDVVAQAAAGDGAARQGPSVRDGRSGRDLRGR